MSNNRIIRFGTLVTPSGYRFATAAEALALSDPCPSPSIFNDSRTPDNLLLPMGETDRPVLLETVDGKTHRYGDGTEPCNPVCDLADLQSKYAARTAVELDRKRNAVIKFIGRYGLPFGGPRYVTIDELGSVASRFASALCASAEHSWIHKARYVERIDHAGDSVVQADNFLSFCSLTASHHLSRRSRFFQCEWCQGWSIGSRRNEQNDTLLKRFCCARCRSMSQRKSASIH